MGPQKTSTLEDVRGYLQTGSFLSSITKQRKRQILQRASKFKLHDSDPSRMKLVERNEGQDSFREVIFSEAEKQAIFHSVHSEGGHMGRTKTFERIQSQFYWEGMKKYVADAIAHCDRCQRLGDIKTMAPEHTPIRTNDTWEVVGIDLVGPLPETPRGNRYILTATDLYSKWVSAFPLQAKSADQVSHHIQTMFHIFGPPKKIITDQGREFCNQVNEVLFQVFQVKHAVTHAYHPQTNGQAERTNGTLKKILMKLCNEQQDDWDCHLGAAAYAMNTSVQESTKFSPFYIMFGRCPRLMADMQINDTPDLDSRVKDIKHGSASVNISANIKKAQERQKKNVELRKNKGFKSFTFRVGMCVLARNNRKKGRKGSRLEFDWLGPYAISNMDFTSAQLETTSGKILSRRVALVHLKPYLESQQIPAPSSPGVAAEPADSAQDAAPCDHGLISNVPIDACIASPSSVFTACDESEGVTEPAVKRRRMNDARRPLTPWTAVPSASDRINISATLADPHCWLNDTVIDAAQSLLARQFPGVSGLQSTVVLQGTNYGGYSEDGHLVQILHVHGLHWVTVARFEETDPGVVFYFDSLSAKSSRVPDFVKNVCGALMYQISPDGVQIEVGGCAQQSDSSSCGLYAIANATAVCFGESPSLFAWKQSELRSHLDCCLRKGVMEMFPVRVFRVRSVFNWLEPMDAIASELSSVTGVCVRLPFKGDACAVQRVYARLLLLYDDSWQIDETAAPSPAVWRQIHKYMNLMGVGHLVVSAVDVASSSRVARAWSAMLASVQRKFGNNGLHLRMRKLLKQRELLLSRQQAERRRLQMKQQQRHETQHQRHETEQQRHEREQERQTQPDKLMPATECQKSAIQRPRSLKQFQPEAPILAVPRAVVAPLQRSATTLSATATRASKIPVLVACNVIPSGQQLPRTPASSRLPPVRRSSMLADVRLDADRRCERHGDGISCRVAEMTLDEKISRVASASAGVIHNHPSGIAEITLPTLKDDLVPALNGAAESEVQANVAVPVEANVAVPGETNVAVSSETNVAVSGEVNVAVPGEANVAVPGETNVAMSCEANVAMPGETNVAVPGEANALATEGGSYKVDHERESTNDDHNRPVKTTVKQRRARLRRQAVIAEEHDDSPCVVAPIAAQMSPVIDDAPVQQGQTKQRQAKPRNSRKRITAKSIKSTEQEVSEASEETKVAKSVGSVIASGQAPDSVRSQYDQSSCLDDTVQVRAKARTKTSRAGKLSTEAAFQSAAAEKENGAGETHQTHAPLSSDDTPCVTGRCLRRRRQCVNYKETESPRATNKPSRKRGGVCADESIITRRVTASCENTPPCAATIVTDTANDGNVPLADAGNKKPTRKANATKTTRTRKQPLPETHLESSLLTSIPQNKIDESSMISGCIRKLRIARDSWD